MESDALRQLPKLKDTQTACVDAQVNSGTQASHRNFD
jgi:hypothetical protein